METLDINHHGGQSFGFIVYSKSNMNSFKLNKNLEITGYVRDRAQVSILFNFCTLCHFFGVVWKNLIQHFL